MHRIMLIISDHLHSWVLPVDSRPLMSCRHPGQVALWYSTAGSLDRSTVLICSRVCRLPQKLCTLLTRGYQRHIQRGCSSSISNHSARYLCGRVV